MRVAKVLKSFSTPRACAYLPASITALSRIIKLPFSLENRFVRLSVVQSGSNPVACGSMVPVAAQGSLAKHRQCECVFRSAKSAAGRPIAAVASRGCFAHVSNRPLPARSSRLRATLASRPSASSSASATSPPTTQLPRTPLAMVEQAAAAVKDALEAGKIRQQLVLLLPVNEKEVDFNSTEPVDYPCSLQKEFDTAVTLTTSILQRVLGAGVNINAKRIDDGGVEGEPCAVLFPDDKSFAAVVFPTSDRLKNIQAYAKEAQRPLLIVNPQWNESGQIVSNFGIGPWRKAAEDFLATFEPAFFLKEKRIGSPGTINAATGTRFTTGGVIRVLRQYPGSYDAWAMAADGSSQLLTTLPKEPTYQELDTLITEGRKQKLEIFDIAKRVTYVFEDGSAADAAAMQPGGGAADAPTAMRDDVEVPTGSLTDADIESMDGATLRRRLTRLGLPTSGKISKLRERLRESRDKEA